METLDATAFFTLALDSETTRGSPKWTLSLIDGLLAMVARLGAVDRVRVCGSVAGSMKTRIRRDQSSETADQLASAILRIAAQMNPAEAQRICGDLARQFLSWIEKEPDCSSAHPVRVVIGKHRRCHRAFRSFITLRQGD